MEMKDHIHIISKYLRIFTILSKVWVGVHGVDAGVVSDVLEGPVHDPTLAPVIAFLIRMISFLLYPPYVFEVGLSYEPL